MPFVRVANADRRHLDDVMSGRVPEDARLANPGMREDYEHLMRMVAGGGTARRARHDRYDRADLQ